MSEHSIQTAGALIPLPRLDLHIRPGVLGDVPFLDSLQKLHTKQVGWMPTAQFEGKIRAGHVLVAEMREGVKGCMGEGVKENELVTPSPTHLVTPAVPVGYCIGNDQYFKRDDVGIIYQMNVVPGKQRGLIGASLLKAQFERSAWGCKLYCCWCAQDIAANQFWEAMGFVPLAFRTGSEKKGPKGRPRIHIFWQKRIRKDDVTTPWWFPAKTDGGAIREGRIVLPIPPGTKWSDAKPMILPAMTSASSVESSAVEGREISAEQKRIEEKKDHGLETRDTRRKAKSLPETSPKKLATPTLGGLRFAAPKPAIAESAKDKPKREKKVKQKTQRVKNDPRMVSAARELRDRWLEEVNSGKYLPNAAGKYEIGKEIEAKAIEPMKRMIEAA